MIEILAIEGAAHARLHQFDKSKNVIEQATQICGASPEVTCGDVMRSGGVLSLQRGQIEAAKQFFEQSLQFARAHNDVFLEETALLNLGAVALQDGHFDEAIDWTDNAYEASMKLGGEGITQGARGNLGWAYYNLGDFEKSLELSLQAESRATQSGSIKDQLYWATNAGYVFAALRDLDRAKQSYLEALDLATKINVTEGIYNAQRALALVSVENGELDQARKYSDEAIASARSDKNRLNELYPLLVKGLIAARSNEAAGAESIFHEVELDSAANDALKWRAEHALAQLHESNGRLNDADREYRAALTTFEKARSNVKRDDSKLPFSNNASRIYDDYIHFLISHNRTDDALRWADYSRARTLAEGLGILTVKGAEGPPPLHAQEIARGVNGTLLFYWLGEKQSYLWAISPKSTHLFPLPPGREIDAVVERYRKSLTGPLGASAGADPGALWLYRTLVAPAQQSLPKDAKVFIVPDGSLNNLNFETLLVPDPSPHYWIEDATITNASSLRVLATPYQADSSPRRLLLIGNSIAPGPQYPELPNAAAQMQSVASHFPAAQEKVIDRGQATPQAYLDSASGKFSHIHFVAHGIASRLSPLDSAIVLSKSGSENDSFKLYGRDIIQHPLHADLVTISACYGAGDRWYAGEGLVGLSWAFLRAGAHNVIGALWEVADASVETLMARFYEELDHGATPDAALRTAKLSLLHSDHFRKPFYWAPFQLYTQGRPSKARDVRTTKVRAVRTTNVPGVRTTKSQPVGTTKSHPRSGERLQPTAQAVGSSGM